MKGINIRWQKYKHNRLAGMNRYKAAVTAGYSKTTARAHALRLELRIMVEKGGLWDALEDAGLTDWVMAKCLVKLTEANKVIPCKILIKQKKNGKYKILKTKGHIEGPDLRLRLNVYELISKLKGHFNNQDTSQVQDPGRLVVVVEKTAEQKEA